MTTKHSPVIVIEVGDHEPCVALFVNGAFICGSKERDWNENESILMKARIIAQAIGCEVQEASLDTSKLGCILQMDDWKEAHDIAIADGLLPSPHADIAERNEHFLYMNHYF